MVDLSSTKSKDCEFSGTSVPSSPCVSCLICNPPYTSYEIKTYYDPFKQEHNTKNSIVLHRLLGKGYSRPGSQSQTHPSALATEFTISLKPKFWVALKEEQNHARDKTSWYLMETGCPLTSCSFGNPNPKAICKLEIQFQVSNCLKSQSSSNK